MYNFLYVCTRTRTLIDRHVLALLVEGNKLRDGACLVFRSFASVPACFCRFLRASHVTSREIPYEVTESPFTVPTPSTGFPYMVAPLLPCVITYPVACF